MGNFIDKIQISGASYDVKDSSIDISQYWTSAQTQSAVTEATSGKVDIASITTAVTTASTDSEIPTAKAVNDAIEAGGSSITIDPTLDGGSTNPVANSAITNAINSKVSDISFDTDMGVKRFLRFSTPNSFNKFLLQNFKINGTPVLKDGYVTSDNLVNYNLVPSSAITTSITSSSTDVQVPSAKAVYDALQGGGGGSSYTAGDGIDITNDVISVTGKVDTTTYNTYTAATDTALASKADTATTYTKTEVDTALSDYVTTNTNQIITSKKTFESNDKAIEFKQTYPTSKAGFTITNSAATNNELASFELRPSTFTIDNVSHPLMYLGHYRRTSMANAGIPQTVIGFRQYDQLNAAAYHYLMPLPEKAKTPFSLTTSFKDYYAPMGFKNGSTMITADDTGVVDLSSELGGMKIVKLTESEYTALVTKDADTLYIVIPDPSN